MTSPVSELFVAIVKIAAAQVRFVLVVGEIVALDAGQMAVASGTEVTHAALPPSFDPEVEAAAQVNRTMLFAGRDGGFRNVLQANFPDDDIRAMAEAALAAALQSTEGYPASARH
jgi:hypothetical protein